MEWFAPGAGGFRIPMRHTFCASKKYAKTGWGFARTASGIRLQPLGRAPQTPLFTGALHLGAVSCYRRVQSCTDFVDADCISLAAA